MGALTFKCPAKWDYRANAVRAAEDDSPSERRRVYGNKSVDAKSRHDRPHRNPLQAQKVGTAVKLPPQR
jgi:hypothetical protein